MVFGWVGLLSVSTTIFLLSVERDFSNPIRVYLFFAELIFLMNGGAHWMGIHHMYMYFNLSVG